jgi:two-component system CheB/CheR fusion protein
MEKYSPAYLIVDQQHQVLKFSGQIGKYIEPSEGPPSFSLFNLVQADLRPPVRDALREATSTQRRVMRQGLAIEVGSKSQTMNLIVEPILQASGPAKYYVVAFQRLSSVGEGDSKTSSEADNLTVQELDNELRATRARLQAGRR